MYMQCIPDFDILDMSASGDEETVELVASTVNSVVDIIVATIHWLLHFDLLLLSENRSLVRLRFAGGRALSVWGETPMLPLVSLVRFLLRFCQLDFAISWNLAKDFSNELNLSMQVLHTLPGKPSPWLIGTPDKLLNLSGTFLLWLFSLKMTV